MSKRSGKNTTPYSDNIMPTRSGKRKASEVIPDPTQEPETTQEPDPTITILIFAHGTELDRTPLVKPVDTNIEIFSLAGTLGLPSVFSNTENHPMSKQYIYSWLELP